MLSSVDEASPHNVATPFFHPLLHRRAECNDKVCYPVRCVAWLCPFPPLSLLILYRHYNEASSLCPCSLIRHTLEFCRGGSSTADLFPSLSCEITILTELPFYQSYLSIVEYIHPSSANPADVTSFSRDWIVHSISSVNLVK